MKSVLDYCTDVQEQLLAMEGEVRSQQDDRSLLQWFGDTGAASTAVSAALMNDSGKALRLAEPIADRWQII
jgi:hypothetical protein